MVQQPAVTSSNIDSVAYNEVTLELLVVFHSGAPYVYRGVDKQTFQDFMNANSKGTFLNATIKKRFGFQKILTDAQTALSEFGAVLDPASAIKRAIKAGAINLRDYLKDGVRVYELFSAV